MGKGWEKGGERVANGRGMGGEWVGNGQWMGGERVGNGQWMGGELDGEWMGNGFCDQLLECLGFCSLSFHFTLTVSLRR